MNWLKLKRVMLGSAVMMFGWLSSMDLTSESLLTLRLAYNPLLLEYAIDRKKAIEMHDEVYLTIPQDNCFTQLPKEVRVLCYPTLLEISSPKNIENSIQGFVCNSKNKENVLNDPDWKNLVTTLPFWLPLHINDLNFYFSKLRFYNEGSVIENRNSLKLALRDRISLSSTSTSMRKIMLADDRQLKEILNSLIIKSKLRLSKIEYLQLHESNR